MSQFIGLPQKGSLESPNILKGIISKVIEPLPTRKSFCRNPGSVNLASTLDTFQNLIDKRFVKEVKIADQLQKLTMNIEYSRLNSKLKKYGRSKSSKLDDYFIIQNQNQRGINYKLKMQANQKDRADILSILKQQQKLARLRRTKNIQNIHDRIVFVQRIYNKQFAIRMSSLIEADNLLLRKHKYSQFLASYKKKEPLIDKIKSKSKKIFSDYQKKSIENLGITSKISKFRKSYKPQRQKNNSSFDPSLKENFYNQFFSLNKLSRINPLCNQFKTDFDNKIFTNKILNQLPAKSNDQLAFVTDSSNIFSLKAQPKLIKNSKQLSSKEPLIKKNFTTLCRHKFKTQFFSLKDPRNIQK